MFCSKCGQELSEGVKFCPKCGNPTSTVETPVVEKVPAVEETPVTPVEAAVENSVDEKIVEPTYGMSAADIPEPEKNSKKGLVIGIVVVLVVAALAVGGYFLYNFLFSPQRIVEKAIRAGKEDVSEAYARGYENMQKAYEDVNGDITTSVSVKLGDQAQTILNEYGSYAGYDLSWIESGSADIALDMQEKSFGLEAKATLNDTYITTIDFVANTDSDTAYLSAPEILPDGGIKVDMNDDAGELQAALDAYHEQIETYSTKYPKPEDMDKALDKYTEVLIADLKKADMKKGRAEITAAGISGKYQEITVNLDDKTTAQITVDMAELLENDDELKEIIKPLMEASMKSADAYDVFDDYDDFWDYLMNDVSDAKKEAQDKLDEIQKNPKKNEVHSVMYLYLDNTFHFRGFAIEDDEENQVFEFYLPEDGDDVGLLTTIKDGEDKVVFEGKGTKKKDKLNGSYTLTVGEDQYFTVEVKDMVQKDVKDDRQFNGQFIFELGDGLVNDISDADMAMFAKAKYDLTVESTNKSGSFKLNILTGDDSFAEVAMKYAFENVEDMKEPAKIYDTNTMTEQEIFDLLKAFKFTSLVKNLESAGVPADYTQKLYELDQALQSGDDMAIIEKYSALFGEETSDYGNYESEDYSDTYEAIQNMTLDEFKAYYKQLDPSASDEDIEYYYKILTEN